MNDNPCNKLEKECEEAWKKWQAALRRDIGGAPPVTEPLGRETPPESGVISTETLNLRHRYDDCAAMLRECYEKHKVPLKERARLRPKSLK
jgi:hypothetical protein